MRKYVGIPSCWARWSHSARAVAAAVAAVTAAPAERRHAAAAAVAAARSDLCQETAAAGSSRSPRRRSRRTPSSRRLHLHPDAKDLRHRRDAHDRSRHPRFGGDNGSALVVTSNGTIDAEGTEDDPIVLTSSALRARRLPATGAASSFSARRVSAGATPHVTARPASASAASRAFRPTKPVAVRRQR